MNGKDKWDATKAHGNQKQTTGGGVGKGYNTRDATSHHGVTVVTV